MSNDTGIKPEVVQAIEQKHFSREELTFILASIVSQESFVSPDEVEGFLNDAKKQTMEYKRWLNLIRGKRHGRSNGIR
jgi:hypothetical protein